MSEVPEIRSGEKHDDLVGKTIMDSLKLFENSFLFKTFIHTHEHVCIMYIPLPNTYIRMSFLQT